MKKSILTAFLFGWLYFLNAQNSSPVVSNVMLTERPDCSYIAEIRYDVYDADGNTMTVNMQVSDDDGATWNFPVNAAHVSGAIGPGITSGANKLITWDFGADHPDITLANVRVKILADDGVVTGPGIPCPGLPSFTYGGDIYHTVKIGTQCWMKENLNIGEMVIDHNTGSQHTHCSNNGIIEKYCYNNDPSMCAVYGGLYDWNEMMGYTTNPGTQGICPPGWHIPTDAEWTVMSDHLGGTTYAGGQMKETGLSHWNSPNNASNASGFTAFGGGQRNFKGGFFALLSYGIFWSSTPSTIDNAWIRRIRNDGVSLYKNDYPHDYGFSVRCIKY